jgi:hypothetical protein
MTATLNAPIIVDLGKTSRKRVRQLKRGQGKLLDDVQDALVEVSTSLGEQADGKQLVPVVLLYRRKSKGRRGGGLFPVLF